MEQNLISLFLNQLKSFKVIDYSVTGEEFVLHYDRVMDMYKTSPQPSLEDLPRYYESEDYISHTNSKRNFYELVYHKVRSYMTKTKTKLAARYVHGPVSVLDFGCGTGDFLLAAKRKGWSTLGFEPNTRAMAIAQEKGIDVCDKEYLTNMPEKSFDVITLWHVLEHLPDLESHIKLFKTLLKPDGVLLVAVPNFKSYDARYYKTKWAAFDVPRHLWHFSKTSIKTLFAQFDFQLLKVKPMWFDAFYVSMLSETYAKSRFSPLKALLIGVYSNFRGIWVREFSSHIYVLKLKTKRCE